MTIGNYDDLLCARDGRILTITINRPEMLNAVSEELHDQLAEVFFEAAADDDSDVIVLTGAGAAFSAGGDFKWLSENVGKPPPNFAHMARAARSIVFGILDCPKPIIARVNGDAYGVGATMALMCDLIVAVDNARFADPHVRAGLSAGDGGALIWPQLLGFPKAKEHLLLGTPISAPDAERYGMINRCVPAAELDEVVGKYARQLAGGAQVAIRYTKSTINIALRELFNSVFEASLAYQGLTRHTSDHQEGVMAFLEKRRPRFTGK